MADRASGLDVLLVEDNEGDARLVEHHLNDPAIDHFVDDLTLTHRESLTAVAGDERGHDVMLLDLGLPESTGLATLDRALEIRPDCPIIVLTGMNDREAAMAAIERGAQDYLPKSELDGDRLVRALRFAVVRRRQQRTLERQTERMAFFNSILRHDILNGMNVIQMRGELLAEELEGDRAEYAETIVRWSDDIVELTRKVRSILDTLTNDGQQDVEPVAVQPMLASVAESVRGMDEGVSVTVDAPADLRVRADDLLRDVVGNLATNAVEHGGDGPTVELTAAEEEGRAVIRVADDGPGVPEERREAIFEQGETGAQSSGTGFGLYFVDAMATSYGGSVEVTDSAAGGAAFELSLERA